MKFLGYFRDIHYRLSKENCDNIIFNLLFLNFHYNEKIVLRKNYKFLKKNDRTKKNAIESAILSKRANMNKVVFLNTFSSAHLIDLAIINNCYKQIDYTSKRQKKGLQFGICSDLITLLFTCYDAHTGTYAISEKLTLFDY